MSTPIIVVKGKEKAEVVHPVDLAGWLADGWVIDGEKLVKAPKPKEAE